MKALVTAGWCVVVSAAPAAQQPAAAPRGDAAPALTMAEIETPSPDAWPSYNGDYSGRRFSPLAKINASKVIEQMVARGATGTDEEFDVVFDYLVAHFGRVAINTAPADEIAQVLGRGAGEASRRHRLLTPPPGSAPAPGRSRDGRPRAPFDTPPPVSDDSYGIFRVSPTPSRQAAVACGEWVAIGRGTRGASSAIGRSDRDSSAE